MKVLLGPLNLSTGHDIVVFFCYHTLSLFSWLLPKYSIQNSCFRGAVKAISPVKYCTSILQVYCTTVQVKDLLHCSVRVFMPTPVLLYSYITWWAYILCAWVLNGSNLLRISLVYYPSFLVWIRLGLTLPLCHHVDFLKIDTSLFFKTLSMSVYCKMQMDKLVAAVWCLKLLPQLINHVIMYHQDLSLFPVKLCWSSCWCCISANAQLGWCNLRIILMFYCECLLIIIIKKIGHFSS